MRGKREKESKKLLFRKSEFQIRTDIKFVELLPVRGQIDVGKVIIF